MKKIIPMLVAIILILIVGGVYLGPEIREHYSYSKEKADLEEYFGVKGKDDVPIILDHEMIEEHAKLIGQYCYMKAEDIDTLLNGRFYIGKADDSLIYTTPEDVITAEIGSGKWSSTDGRSGDEKYEIAMYDGETLFICLDYVRKFTDFSSDLYTDPNRLVIATSWEKEERTRITRKTSVRVKGGIKSEILCEVNKNAAVRVVEEMDTWSKIQTDDGFSGYVENKRLGDKVEYTPDHVSDVKEQEYTSISKPYMINMAWHLILGKDGNSTLTELIAATDAGEENGFNTIAPTWFQLCDGEGNIENNASSEYVKEAHAAGLEVWGVVDNFNNENADTASSLATRENRQRLIDHLVEVSLEIGTDGINVDFEQVPVTSGEDFVEFIRELSIPCRKNGLVLSVDNYVPMGALNDHYDRKEQGVVADYCVVMGYDEHYKGSEEAGSVASIDFVDNGIRRTVADVPPEKVIGGMPFYTRVWATKDNSVDSDALSMKKAKEWIEERGVTLTWNDETCQNYGEITDGDGTLRQIWMEDAESISTKIAVMRGYGIAGVAAWQLGFETPDIWDVIRTSLTN